MEKLQSVNRERFGDIWKLRGGFLGVWKLGIVAHEKLRVCNRVYGETSGCFSGNFGVLFGCGGGGHVGCMVVCSLFVLSFVSSFSTFSAFVRFGGFCRWGGTQKG